MKRRDKTRTRSRVFTNTEYTQNAHKRTS